jgi:hypothetical protein
VARRLQPVRLATDCSFQSSRTEAAHTARRPASPYDRNRRYPAFPAMAFDISAYKIAADELVTGARV